MNTFAGEMICDSSFSNGINDRGVWGGGKISGSNVNGIEKITISTTGNGTDFGDLTVARRCLTGTSNG